jgi:1,2-diacylglycerol 3-beta-galactosyltransferase
MATRVFISMSDTGGGHRAISYAVRGALTRLYGSDVETTVSDVFNLGRRSIFDDATRLYNPVLRHAPWLYGIVYKISDRKHVYSTLAKQVELLDAPKIKRTLAAAKPDVIVSIHPLTNRPLIRARASLGWDVPIVAIVTELVTVHRSWVDPAIDYYTTATPETQAAVLGLGADPRRVFQVGLPVDERFGSVEESPSAIRRRYGLDPRRFTVLLSGGGEGAGGLSRVLMAADRAGFDAQFMVVCGRNSSLKKRLESRHLTIGNKIFGFVDNMHELVHACDVVVTKGGPGSISEALAGKRPVLLTAITPGQEEGNDHFVERHGVGLAPRSTAGLVEALRMLAAHPDARARLSRNAERLSRPEAAAHAARLIVDAAGRREHVPFFLP